MKVAEAITDTNIGGAGRLLITRLAYSDRNHIQTVVLLSKGSALKKPLEAISIPIIEINGCRDRSFELFSIRKYRNALRTIKPDLVNCHGSLSCRVAARLCRVPVCVYTRHCVYSLAKWKKTAFGRAVLGTVQSYLSDGIIAVANAAKNNLVQMGVPAKKIRVIINGVEGLKRMSGKERAAWRKKLHIPQNSFVIGICARLEPCKGHMDFLYAAAILCKQSANYRFLVVGDGSIRYQLEKKARELGISKHVIFTGFAEDVTPYFNMMDLNVNCSRGTETSSLALSEGMSLGIPAVVSDYGGNPYMVRHGENGLVYPVGDYHQLAKDIDRLFHNPSLYSRMSHKARQRFLTELNAEQMTSSTERFYFELFHTSKKVRGRGRHLRWKNRSKEQRHPQWS